jgi:hypothetical protein
MYIGRAGQSDAARYRASFLPYGSGIQRCGDQKAEMGATTIWERWDAIRPDGSIFNPQMNPYNHYAYGAVCQWLLEAVAGLRPDETAPGFARIIFEPTIIPQLSPIKVRGGPGNLDSGISGFCA